MRRQLGPVMTTLQLQCQITTMFTNSQQVCLLPVEVVKSLHVPPCPPSRKKLEQLGMKNAKNKNKTKIQSKIKGTLGCC